MLQQIEVYNIDLQIDRILPIGEFVQPSLLENWISTLFVFFGQGPILKTDFTVTQLL